MTIFNISDITPAGAFTNAVTAAQDSDRRNAGGHSETTKDPMVTGFLTILARRIAAAMAEIGQTASQPASRLV